jgi:tetratricopeptide (TPR) repeat protein
VALEAQGQFAEALERYRAAVHISPGEVSFQRNLALVLCRLSRWEDAIPELRAVLRAVPGDPDATKALDVALERAPHRR